MDRRQFLKMLGLGAAALVVPKLLLPPTKKFFLPLDRRDPRIEQGWPVLEYGPIHPGIGWSVDESSVLWFYEDGSICWTRTKESTRVQSKYTILSHLLEHAPRIGALKMIVVTHPTIPMWSHADTHVVAPRVGC